MAKSIKNLAFFIGMGYKFQPPKKTNLKLPTFVMHMSCRIYCK